MADSKGHLSMVVLVLVAQSSTGDGTEQLDRLGVDGRRPG